MNSIDGRYQPYAVKLSAPESASQDAAAVAAAHRVLVRLFPAQQVALDQTYATSLAAIADGVNKDRGIDAGEAAALAIRLLRSNDGRGATVPYIPGHGSGIWEPTPPGFQAAQTPWLA